MSEKTAMGWVMLVIGIALAIYGLKGMKEFSQSFDAVIVHRTDTTDMLILVVGVFIAIIGRGLLRKETGPPPKSK